jgi:chromosomal replication initiation ATPase DnaA
METRIDFIQNVIEVVERHDLKKVSRKQEIIYPRYYIYSLLRDAKYSLSAIGRIFNKDHATVLHGIRMHKLFTRQNDKVYEMLIEQVKSEIYITPKEYNLKEEVLKCTSIKKLEIIKKQILENYY